MLRLWMTVLLTAAASLPSAAQQQSPTEPPETIEKVGGDVTPPHVTFSVQAPPTEYDRTQGVDGVCTLSLVVDAHGKPQNIKPIHCIDRQEAAWSVNALRQYDFDPARKNGKPVAVQITFEVNFHFNSPGPEKSSWCNATKGGKSLLSYAFRSPPGAVSTTPDANGIYSYSPELSAPGIASFFDDNFCETSDAAFTTSKCNVVLTIAEDGKLTDLQSPHCSSEQLEKPFASSIRKSRFEPGLSNGKPVPMRLFFFLEFNPLSAEPTLPEKP